MNAVDDILDGLREQGAEPRLAAMEDAVLRGVAIRRERGAARRALAFTGIFALGVGLAGSLVVPRPTGTGQAAMLNGLPASAPSSLLLGRR